MNRSTLISLVLLVLGGGFLVVQATTRGVGRIYVQEIAVDGESPRIIGVDPRLRSEPGVTLSPARTIGVWVAALLTLCVFSFLYGDNPLYKFAEALFVGASAAYAMVVGFWTEIVQNLIAKLFPAVVRSMGITAGETADAPQYLYIVPLVLGIMMLWRLAPAGGWISRWPLAFFIGATAGIRLVANLESDFVAQVAATMLPLLVVGADRSIDWSASLQNTLIVVGVLSCLTYFFFSVEHTGIAGRVSRLGIWFLMITFGASFGYTVMGRIALLAERLEFLFDDWLWLIDPVGKRLGM
jgi:hypothetical protein